MPIVQEVLFGGPGELKQLITEVVANALTFLEVASQQGLIVGEFPADHIDVIREHNKIGDGCTLGSPIFIFRCCREQLDLSIYLFLDILG